MATGRTVQTHYYDVFLSFRGEDTRHLFTKNLYDALRRKGINTFIDDRKLGKGKKISATLLKAIERSRLSLVVFSENYATSTWCLDELVKIVECKEQKNQPLCPIFYKVDPSDVRLQRNSYGVAMATLEHRFRHDLQKVNKWRFALSQAATFSGWHFQHGDEFMFIERIAEQIFKTLPPKRTHISEHIVGLKFPMEEVKSLLDSVSESDNNVCMLGIHGAGGIGKTTLAKALYHSTFHQFEGSCFLFDVREISKQYKGLVRLQQSLLSEILEETKIKVGSVDEGISKIKHRLCHKRILLVLDDVDDVEQLEKLAGKCDWFGSGSRIIITARDKHLLTSPHVNRTYQMKGLNDHDALELFSWHAFNMTQPASGYEEMSNYVVSYAQGLPLVLEVIGSNLTHKSLEAWKCILKQYESIPDRNVLDILKISYDNLEDNAKCIFLDIACFFKRRPLEFVEEILDASGFGAKFYIEVLVDKYLLSVNGFGCLWMHDLIQEMGKDIVRMEAPSEPGQRSRLWCHDDICRILHENSGSRNIEGMMLDPPENEEVEWNGTSFEKINNLRILIVRNTCFSTAPKHLPNNLRLLDWEGYPSTSLPQGFYPRNIVVLKLRHSLFRLQEPLKRFEYLTDMYFSHCEFITQIPDVSGAPNLRELVFKDCCNVTKIHNSVGSLSRLIQLDVSGCTKLITFPHKIKMASLEMLDLTGCKSLNYFPNIIGKMDALKTILAEDTGIKELPHSIGNLSGLELLDMNCCKNLRHLPSSLFMLQNLGWLLLGDSRPRSRKSFRKSMQENHMVVAGRPNLQFLNLENCGILDEDLHLVLDIFSKLQGLFLSGNDFVSLPECIKECANLLELDVTGCKKLQDIPQLPSNLKIIKAENCTSLTTESSGWLWSQAMNEVRDLLIKMPETSIPDWFDHRCEDGAVSFCTRGKFPSMALAFVLGHGNVKTEDDRECHVEVYVRINGREVHRKNSPSHLHCPIIEGNLLLWDLRQIFREAEWESLGALPMHDWNDVEIQAVCDSTDFTIRSSGVYVYKQQINMEDIQFKSPKSINSTGFCLTSTSIARNVLKRKS
ncbi:TMV resistance protein N-like [Abrus precatorius]|uniref:TMV resistance protein N-like n=1 Tax=Abrus precatorius TaxID=3816 RepID=A0A8B8LKD2_ABRPR|nr:TMV resistance protein N-like [Abrus precatorius]